MKHQVIVIRLQTLNILFQGSKSCVIVFNLCVIKGIRAIVKGIMAVIVYQLENVG